MFKHAICPAVLPTVHVVNGDDVSLLLAWIVEHAALEAAPCERLVGDVGEVRRHLLYLLLLHKVDGWFGTMGGTGQVVDHPDMCRRFGTLVVERLVIRSPHGTVGWHAAAHYGKPILFVEQVGAFHRLRRRNECERIDFVVALGALFGFGCGARRAWRERGWHDHS